MKKYIFTLFLLSTIAPVLAGDVYVVITATASGSYYDQESRRQIYYTDKFVTYPIRIKEAQYDENHIKSAFDKKILSKNPSYRSSSKSVNVEKFTASADAKKSYNTFRKSGYVKRTLRSSDAVRR